MYFVKQMKYKINLVLWTEHQFLWILQENPRKILAYCSLWKSLKMSLNFDSFNFF